MTSRRQRARARRTAPFWAAKLARAATPFDRAQVRYDRARAEVEDLAPVDRADGWARLEAVLEQLHARWADERALRVWQQLVPAARSPQRRVWQAWRRLWAVVATLDKPDAAWQVVESEMERAAVTLSHFSGVPNSAPAEPARVGSTGRRGPAGARVRREQSVPSRGPNSGPEDTLRSQIHGRTAG